MASRSDDELETIHHADAAALRKLRDECECEYEDYERLSEGDKVEANYRGCLVRVGYSPFLSRVPRRRRRGGAPTQARQVLSRKDYEGPRR